MSQTPAPHSCSECGKPILTMAFMGTGVCGELCRKKRDGEENERPAAYITAPTPVLKAPGKIKSRGVPDVRA